MAPRSVPFVTDLEAFSHARCTCHRQYITFAAQPPTAAQARAASSWMTTAAACAAACAAAVACLVVVAGAGAGASGRCAVIFLVVVAVEAKPASRRHCAAQTRKAHDSNKYKRENAEARAHPARAGGATPATGRTLADTANAALGWALSAAGWAVLN
jgi:hypothetical protein